MCAIDALGIAPMLNTDAHIDSTEHPAVRSTTPLKISSADPPEPGLSLSDTRPVLSETIRFGIPSYVLRRRPRVRGQRCGSCGMAVSRTRVVDRPASRRTASSPSRVPDQCCPRASVPARWATERRMSAMTIASSA
ncbi:hypothetical protein ACTXG6_16035 [Pseudonocardia sp. Cha107L01]|uniref:hypothetical protein n=1 Tax=Pseudonocardia sp. Cha107L01 TaxID=3457576 RepID=UPI00403EB74F